MSRPGDMHEYVNEVSNILDIDSRLGWMEFRPVIDMTSKQTKES